MIVNSGDNRTEAVALSLVFASLAALKTYAAILGQLKDKQDLQPHEKRVLDSLYTHLQNGVDKYRQDHPDQGHDSMTTGSGGSISVG